MQIIVRAARLAVVCTALLTSSVWACDLSLLLGPKAAADKTVVIVGGYSSGNDIAPALRARGINKIIHIQPSAEVPGPLKVSFKPDDYQQQLTYDGGFNELLAKLKDQHIDAVIAGSEVSVELADRLAETLGITGNGTALTSSRRNKYEMHQRLKQQGVRSMRDLRTSNLDELLKWVEAPEGNQGVYPVVVKPIDGAGTQGFHLCFNKADVIHAYKSLIGTKNMLDLPIDVVLAQEYLDGEEYVVNTVSRDGKHVVGEVWHYHKKRVQRPDGGYSNIYLYDELLAFDSDEAKALIPYAFEVINALGIKQGPGHSEIMMTKRGPVLVETGARLMGGHTFSLTREAIGISPLDLLVKAYLFPEEFYAIHQRGAAPLARHKHVRNVQLIASQSGTITGVNYTQAELAAELGSYMASSMAGVGDTLTPTVDLITSPGAIFLVSDSEQALERDYQHFRQVIEPKLFQVKK